MIRTGAVLVVLGTSLTACQIKKLRENMYESKCDECVRVCVSERACACGAVVMRVQRAVEYCVRVSRAVSQSYSDQHQPPRESMSPTPRIYPTCAYRSSHHNQNSSWDYTHTVPPSTPSYPADNAHTDYARTQYH